MKTFIKTLQKNWNAIENLLLIFKNQKSFILYLRQYKGIAPSTPPQSLEILKELVQYLFSTLEEGLSSGISEEKIRSCEKHLNLCFYYWRGEQNKEYTLRALVDFCGWNLLSYSQKIQGTPLTLTFQRWGLQIDLSPAPSRLPLIQAVGHLFPILPWNHPYAFSRLHTVQREICLLLEEWEYRNTQMAVFYNNNEEHNKRVNIEFRKHRNHMSEWIFESLCLWQEGLSKSYSLLPHEDFKQEWEATQNLLLSCLQKLYLPASISRHKYPTGYFNFLNTWCQSRLLSHPEDISTKLIYYALNIEQRELFPDVILSQKAYEWSFPYDPLPALKAISWKHPLEIHKRLVAICVFIHTQKRSPHPLSLEDLYHLSHYAEIPQSFEAPPEEVMPISPDKYPPFLQNEAIAHIQKITKIPDEGQESYDSLLSFLQGS